MPDAVNDDGYARPPVAIPSAHGEAALILVESLIHCLVARSTLSLADALDVVRSAADVQRDVCEARGDDPGIVPAPGQLLATIAASLGIDARPDPAEWPRLID